MADTDGTNQPPMSEEEVGGTLQICIETSTATDTGEIETKIDMVIPAETHAHGVSHARFCGSGGKFTLVMPTIKITHPDIRISLRSTGGGNAFQTGLTPVGPPDPSKSIFLRGSRPFKVRPGTYIHGAGGTIKGDAGCIFSDLTYL